MIVVDVDVELASLHPPPLIVHQRVDRIANLIGERYRCELGHVHVRHPPCRETRGILERGKHRHRHAVADATVRASLRRPERGGSRVWLVEKLVGSGERLGRRVRSRLTVRSHEARPRRCFTTDLPREVGGIVANIRTDEWIVSDGQVAVIMRILIPVTLRPHVRIVLIELPRVRVQLELFVLGLGDRSDYPIQAPFQANAEAIRLNFGRRIVGVHADDKR